MRRQDDDAVRALDLLARPLDARVSDAVELDLRHPWVAHDHVSAALDQEPHHLEARRLARVVDVGLVRHPEQEQARALDRLAVLVQRVRDLPDHEGRHARVDLVRGVDQARRVAVLPHPRGQELRHDRDAVAAEAGARVVGEEGERLGRRGLDHLPGRDPEPVADQRQLVGERDVHRAERVLVQLGGLGHDRARDRDDVVDDLPVEELRPAAALGRHAAHELRRRLDREAVVARVDTLRRVAEEHVLADLRARSLEDRLHDLLGRAGRRRRLEDDELAGVQVRGDRLGGGDDVTDVGRAGLRERRWDADGEGVQLTDGGVVACRAQVAFEALVALGRHVHEVRLVLRDGPDPLLVQIEPGDVEAGLGEGHRERQAGVAEADDADLCLSSRDALVEGGRIVSRCGFLAVENFGQERANASKMARRHHPPEGRGTRLRYLGR